MQYGVNIRITEYCGLVLATYPLAVTIRTASWFEHLFILLRTLEALIVAASCLQSGHTQYSLSSSLPSFPTQCYCAITAPPNAVVKSFQKGSAKADYLVVQRRRLPQFWGILNALFSRYLHKRTSFVFLLFTITVHRYAKAKLGKSKLYFSKFPFNRHSQYTTFTFLYSPICSGWSSRFPSPEGLCFGHPQQAAKVGAPEFDNQ
jgi:hypothetical protein